MQSKNQTRLVGTLWVGLIVLFTSGVTLGQGSTLPKGRAWITHHTADSVGFSIFSLTPSSTVTIKDRAKKVETSFEVTFKANIAQLTVPKEKWTSTCELWVNEDRAIRFNPRHAQVRTGLNVPQRIAIIGHTGGSRGLRFEPPQTLANRLATLQLDAVIHAGDIARHPSGMALCRDFFRPMESLLETAPLYLAPGNHECEQQTKGGYDYSAFMSAFPYPWEPALKQKGIPAYSLKIGPAEFFFCAYYPSLLGPDSKELAWMTKGVRNSTSAYKIAVVGGNQSTWDKANFIEKIGAAGADAVIMGDGQGFSLRRRGPGQPVLIFNGGGSGKTKSHRPYTVLELSALSIVVNTFLTNGDLIHTSRIPCRKPLITAVNLSSAFSNGSISGSKVEAAKECSESKITQATSSWLSSSFAPTPIRELSGLEVNLNLVSPSANRANVWAKFLISDGKESTWYISNPEKIDSGSVTRLRWALPKDLANRDQLSISQAGIHFGVSRMIKGLSMKVIEARLFK